MEYEYPVIFSLNDNGAITISIPDFPEQRITCGNNIDEALDYASKLLHLAIREHIKNNTPLPKPSTKTEITLSKKDIGLLLQVRI